MKQHCYGWWALLLLLAVFSCEGTRVYDRNVSTYFQTWEGAWRIDQITYLDKDTSFKFSTDHPQIQFFSCPEVSRQEGGMCEIRLLDRKGNAQSLLGVGSFTEEEAGKGEIRLELGLSTALNESFNDSLLLQGIFTTQQQEPQSALLRGGRIPNFAEGGAFFSQEVELLIRRL